MDGFWDWFWLMVWWFFFIAYLVVLFQIVADLFRDKALSGWWKALWIIALIFGTPAAYPLFSGFIAGYLTYDYTHFHLHHHVPKTAAGKQLREQHMRHHFQDHRYGYGVSSPLWDYVFRTRSQKLKPR